MSQVREEGVDLEIADCIVAVAESTSLRSFSGACQRAIYQLTGSSTIGLYMLKGEPQLLCSRDAPEGFLADYRTGMAKRDLMIESVLEDGQVVDGASVFGPYQWPRSVAFDLLHSWGFSWNMCGPLRYENEVVGIIYTATRHARAPYTQERRRRMEILCRAASLALTNLLLSGQLDRRNAGTAVSNLPVVGGTSSLQLLLPPRSAEVAFCVCRGQTNKQIARAMGISDQTVKEHITNLFRRFNVQNRTELVALLLSDKSRH